MVKQNVFRLKIPIDSSLVMQCFKSEDNLSCIKANSLFGESLFAVKMVEKFATIQKIHHYVQLILSLKGIVHVYNEGTINFLKNLTLRLGMIYLVPLENVLLPEHFHGI